MYKELKFENGISVHRFDNGLGARIEIGDKKGAIQYYNLIPLIRLDDGYWVPDNIEPSKIDLHMEVVIDFLAHIAKKPKVEKYRIKFHTINQPSVKPPIIKSDISEKQLKRDDNKVRYDLIDPSVLSDIAEVFTFGAVKYSDKNYLNGLSNDRMYSACMRHLESFRKGIPVDEESGKSHLIHAICNLIMMEEVNKVNLNMEPNEHYSEELPDDRIKQSPAYQKGVKDSLKNIKASLEKAYDEGYGAAEFDGQMLNFSERYGEVNGSEFKREDSYKDGYSDGFEEAQEMFNTRFEKINYDMERHFQKGYEAGKKSVITNHDEYDKVYGDGYDQAVEDCQYDIINAKEEGFKEGYERAKINNSKTEDIGLK
jgi:hypothetical protein